MLRKKLFKWTHSACVNRVQPFLNCTDIFLELLFMPRNAFSKPGICKCLSILSFTRR